MRIILDTQLLCLLTVGRLGWPEASRHKRLQAYSAADFDILARALAHASQIVTTAHILAETSNLLRQTAAPIAHRAMSSLGELVPTFVELTPAGAEIVTDPTYIRLGVTDAAIIRLIATGFTLLTADLDLYLACASLGNQSFNFNHLRDRAITL